MRDCSGYFCVCIDTIYTIPSSQIEAGREDESAYFSDFHEFAPVVYVLHLAGWRGHLLEDAERKSEQREGLLSGG